MTLTTVPDHLVGPVRPDDGPALAAMFGRCSPETRYARFLAPVARIPADHLAAVVEPPAGDRSWVVTSPAGAVVGLGSLFGVASGAAELGLLVEDGWQRRGFGSLLLAAALGHARAAGIREVHALTLVAATHVRRMLARHGPLTSHPDGPTTDLVLHLGAAAG